MEYEETVCIKKEESDELLVAPEGMVLEDSLAILDCVNNIKEEPEVTFDDEVENNSLHDPLSILDCIKKIKKEPEVPFDEDQLEDNNVGAFAEDVSPDSYPLSVKEEEDVSSAEYATDTTRLYRFVGEIQSVSHGTYLQTEANDLVMGTENSTHLYACEVLAQPMVPQQDNSYCMDNKRLTEDKVCDFTCSSCEMSFSLKYSLILHVFIHIEGVEPPVHVCRSCGNVYHSRVRLRNHLRMSKCGLVYATGKLYECYVCQRLFCNAYSLKGHSLIHTGVKPHQCDVCSKTFRTTGTLKRHALGHSGMRPHKCAVCDKSFSTATCLKRHAVIHSGMRPHKCAVCDKSFSMAASLKEHAVIHSGIWAHKCAVCDKSFRSVSNLRVHAKIHSEMTPHKCAVCDKSFRMAAHLKRHALIHSERIQPKCAVCDKSFSTAANLKRHAVIHSGMR